MPIYPYECPNEHETDVVSSVNDRPDKIICMECGKDARRVIPRVVVRGDGPEYADENLCDANDPTPFHVRGNSHKRQRLRDLGLAQKEPTDRDRDKQQGRGRLTFPLKVN